MVRRSHARAGLSLLITVAAVTPALGDDKALRELLLRSLRQALSVNVIAIVEQRGLNNMLQKIKIEQCSSGKQARTVLQPLSLQGVRILDDGEVSVTFLPDERILIEQASNRELLRDADLRAALAGRNYKLSLGGKEEIAGRTAIALVAQPKVPTLPRREFYIDEATLFPLRVVTVDVNGQKQIRVDTKAIAFPAEVHSASFTVSRTRQLRKVRYEHPFRVRGETLEPHGLGFTPRVPRALPFGFVVQEAEVQSTPEGQTAVVRLTDGLARATVYQTRSNRFERPLRHTSSRTLVTAAGITYVLVSDLSPEARVQLLSAFVKLKPAIAGDQQYYEQPPSKVPYREPGRQPQAFGEVLGPSRENPGPRQAQPLELSGRRECQEPQDGTKDD